MGAEWQGACWKSDGLDFDQNVREIGTRYLVNVCATRYFDFPRDRYRVENNRLILIHKEELDGENCAIIYSDLIGGAMRVTKVLRHSAR